ncbi:membrane bound O-acyl transferase family-domain-containing protein [Mycena latifolia]|nr:membrane bound O-acyl transferase family-domain-containing protein [Mycena latifolia]
MPLFVWTPFPYAYFTLYFTLILTSLTIQPSPYRRWFFVPLLLLTWRLIHDTEAEYLTSTLCSTTLLMASDYILLTDVQCELTQVPEDVVNGQSPPKIEHASLAQRTKWAVTLFFNPRGVSWAHDPRAALPTRAPPNTSRANFLAQQSARLACALLLFDLANLHARWNPAWRLRTGMAAAGLGWRVLGTLGWAGGAAAGLSLAHCIASIVCVALGVSRPQDWPPLFGGWADVHSLRAFWARGWHQILRRSLCAHGTFVAHTLLRLPRGSAAAARVQLCTAFALSGLVHHLGETAALRRAGARSGSLLFFALQPAAIALEARRGVALGPAWVFAWFALTLPIMQDPLLRAGELSSPVDVSLVMWVCNGTWVLPPLPST